jgi:hypothetical protein
MPNFKPKDIIAILVLIIIGALKMMNKDGGLDTVAALILGYYFAHRKNGTDNGV